MSKDEALRFALEALETSMYPQQKQLQAITAIKAALEAKDEPVAWVYPEFWQHLENLNCGTAYRLSGIGRQPLYTTPPPVAEPHKRTWQSLTDEEIQDALEAEFLGSDLKRNWQDDLRVARAIEAKLKEKNT